MDYPTFKSECEPENSADAVAVAGGHISVMPQEVLTYLNPQPGQIVVDATLGGGGHSRLVAPHLQPGGRLIGLDQDAGVLARTMEALPGVTGIHANFSQLPQVLHDLGIERITGGLLADIGVSSFQLDDGARGFSFNKEAPLDMRMDTSTGPTAAELVNTLREEELLRIFSEYGEARFSKTIARAMVQHRRTQPIETTTELAGLVADIYRQHLGRAHYRIHPATQVFQALRIAVNDELGHLERLLAALPHCLAPGARAVIITFHSLEDRIVKQAFKAAEATKNRPGCYRLLTKKPVTPTEEEIRRNPRARSAKLRAVEIVYPSPPGPLIPSDISSVSPEGQRLSTLKGRGGVSAP